MNYEKTIQRFSGMASGYHTFRPAIPADLIQFLLRLYRRRPELVVDMGCGTGISTMPWKEHAAGVIGIDPSADMIAEAQKTRAGNIRFLQGYGHNTGLENAVADIITFSSSLHWMEPVSTISEVDRILKENGVFCSYGYYFPFFSESWELTKAYEEWRLHMNNIRSQNPSQFALQYNIDETIELFKRSKIFKYLRKSFMHSIHSWSYDDFEGLIKLYKEAEMDSLQDLLTIAKKEFAGRNLTAYITYTIWTGIH